jgi:O-antigen ligase
VIWLVGTAALLRIERLRSKEVSIAVWIPTAWLLLIASKPLGRWFGTSAGSAVEDGSALDRWALLILMSLAVAVVAKRKFPWKEALRNNSALVLLYVFFGLSIVWSDFSFVSFKRWIRLAGAIPIIMVVLSERHPFAALEASFRRSFYILIPASLLLIKYFPDFGVEYQDWTGIKSWLGVAKQKNGLGLLSAVATVFFAWGLIRRWRKSILLSDRSRLVADIIVLATAFHLLLGGGFSYSATSIGLVIVGVAGLIFLMPLERNLSAGATPMIVSISLLLAFLPVASSITPALVEMFGRDMTFTGRTDIWAAVLAVAAESPILGTGYGAFWYVADDAIFAQVGIHESHNGYLNVYLEGGIVGVLFLFVFLVAYFRRLVTQAQSEHEWCVLGVVLLAMLLIQNFTEDNILKTTGYLWTVTIFMAVTLSSARRRSREPNEQVPENDNLNHGLRHDQALRPLSQRRQHTARYPSQRQGPRYGAANRENPDSGSAQRRQPADGPTDHGAESSSMPKPRSASHRH